MDFEGTLPFVHQGGEPSDALDASVGLDLGVLLDAERRGNQHCAHADLLDGDRARAEVGLQHHLLPRHQALVAEMLLRHALGQAVAALAVCIGCGDVAVFPGDVVVGDDEGVVIVPAHMADEIAAEATEMTAFEDFVSEEVAGGRSIIGLYPATDPAVAAQFAAWRKSKGR